MIATTSGRLASQGGSCCDEWRRGIEHQEDSKRGERTRRASVDRMVTLDVCRTLIDIP